MNIGILEIVNAVVCEDVRREVNGKEILIGVYGSAILVPSFPTDLGLVFWVQSKAPVGKHDIRFRLVNSAEAVFFEASITADIANAEEIASLAFAAGVQAQADTLLEFQGRLGDGAWTTIRTMPIRRAAMNQPARQSEEVVRQKAPS